MGKRKYQAKSKEKQIEKSKSYLRKSKEIFKEIPKN